MWETLVVVCHRRASSLITITLVKQDTSLVHVKDLRQSTVLEHKPTIHIVMCESKIDQKSLPAVEPKIQVLKHRPSSTAVLRAVQFICAHCFDCIVV